MKQSEISVNIALLDELINSPDTPTDEKEMARENLVSLKAMLKEPSAKEAEDEDEDEDEKTAEDKPRKYKKETKPRKKVIEMTKDSITYKGNSYTLSDCKALFDAFKNKLKAGKKSSVQSAARTTAEKIIDKAQTTIKQLLKDKSAQKKIENNPVVAKRELKAVEMKFRAFIEAIEKFLGKKMNKSQVDSIFSIIHKQEMEVGGRILSAIKRDRKYVSDEDWEKNYKRKKSPKNKKYAAR